ncbi:MAG: hypothetical protein L7F78_10085 [Syntrophales bacterium LBB04]|nr:hypothetical protein [Syntrophales bacterium LBB04]
MPGREGPRSLLRNRKGEVELVKATFAGLKEAHPTTYYRQIPSWVLPEYV